MASIAPFSCSFRSGVRLAQRRCRHRHRTISGRGSEPPTNSKPAPLSVLRKPVAESDRIGQQQVDPAGNEVEIGLVLGAIADDLDHVAEVVGQEAVVGGGTLHAHLLAGRGLPCVIAMPEPFLATKRAGVW